MRAVLVAGQPDLFCPRAKVSIARAAIAEGGAKPALLNAAVFVTDCVTEAWLPKSQIGYDGIPGDKAVEIELPVWLAEKTGLI